MSPNSILRWNGTGSTGITGLTATIGTVTIVNASTDYLLWLENENTASAAANRMMLPDSFPAFLMPGDTITLMYDGTAARWRVLSWPTRGVQMGLTEFSDAFGQNNSSMMPFQGGAAGTGASVTVSSWGVTSAVRAAGAQRLVTGTTATGAAYAGQYNGAWRTGLGTFLFAAAVARQTAANGTETYSIQVGLSEANAAITDAIMWEYRWNGSAVEWAQTVADNGSITRSTTNSPSPTTLGSNYAKLAIFVNPSGSAADFLYSLDSVSWSLAQRVSSGLPTGSDARVLGPGYQIIKSAGLTSRDAYVDWAGYRIQQVRG